MAQESKAVALYSRVERYQPKENYQQLKLGHPLTLTPVPQSEERGRESSGEERVKVVIPDPDEVGK